MVEQKHIKAAEAIIWIAYGKRLTFEQLLNNWKQENIFWAYAFKGISPITFKGISPIIIKEKWTNAHGITKGELLSFAEQLAEKKTWTESEWKAFCNDVGYKKKKIENIGAKDLLKKQLQDVCKEHKFLPLHQFIERLKTSITDEEKLLEAERKLINAAINKSVTIYGIENSGNGDVKEIPIGFLLRSDFVIALLDNKTTASVQNANAKQIERNGWHDLMVEGDVAQLLSNDDSAEINKLHNTTAANKARQRWQSAVDEVDNLKKEGKSEIDALRQLHHANHSSVGKNKEFASYKSSYYTAVTKYKLTPSKTK